MKKIIIIGGTEFLGFHTVNFFSKNSLFKKYTNRILSSHNAFNTKDKVEFVNRNTLNNIFKGLDLNAENIKKF